MKLLFRRKKHETSDVWSFYFEPARPIAWTAGQSIRLELPRPTWGIVERRFTIASAPHERLLQITTRLSGSEFKNLLDKLTPGQEIDGHNIEGNFTFENVTAPIFAIAGGVGVTPFRSMLIDMAHKNSLHDVILLHRGSDSPAIFESELNDLVKNNPGLDYRQLSERLTASNLESLVPDWRSRLVYLSGSAGMVRELVKIFALLGIPSSQIKTDIFTGNIS